ncbi:hypothetical protein AVEN_62164-1 [Araneus ventricosus]|uniref:Uncharacterized protein n=1 Tax=Araneus ventricosus TaxID=182803 RepID=A0A4Y2TJ33_ARAVE|nr:hypothetical protein AVEN_190706-1 [Araneus ventricosus]GBN99125.1 hypothetical protein AVEN_62164-1 [Araneus ventricosus]
MSGHLVKILLDPFPLDKVKRLSKRFLNLNKQVKGQRGKYQLPLRNDNRHRNLWIVLRQRRSISTIKAEHLKHFPNNAYLRRVEFTRIISNVPPATLPASSLQSFSFRSTDSAVPWWPLEGSWPLSPRYYARSLWVVSHTHRATSQSIYRSEESLKGSDLQQEKSRCPNPIKESRKLS